MILLDTHALVWLVGAPERLSRAAADAIRGARASGGLGIASISLWELAMLFERGRLRGRGTTEASIQQIVESSRVTVREITPMIAALSTQFPVGFPLDPADRLIAATARAEGMALVTRDAQVRECKLVKTVW